MSHRGFTLIGLLVALAIVGWLWVMQAHQRTHSLEPAAATENQTDNSTRAVTTIELKQHVEDKLQQTTKQLEQREQSLETE